MAKKNITYKEAITEIEEIIEKIDNRELDVDELSKNVNRVSELLKICKTKLHKTEEDVKSILNDIDE